MSTKFEKAIQLIDNENSKDIRKESFDSKEYPKELLYSYRMTNKLIEFQPNASDELKLAARAQHINRWEIARSTYSMDRVGYLKWREALKKMHADITSSLLAEVGYDSDFINRVVFLINKKLIKKDAGSQILEDVVCLVFLEYYFDAFSRKHDDTKLIDIIKKTWNKMSEKGHNVALKIPFSEKNLALVKEALHNY